jgi:hypothetical protein
MNYQEKILELEKRLNMAARIVAEQQNKIEQLNRIIEITNKEKQRVIFELDQYCITDAQSDIGALIERIEKLEKENEQRKGDLIIHRNIVFGKINQNDSILQERIKKIEKKTTWHRSR